MVASWAGERRPASTDPRKLEVKLLALATFVTDEILVELTYDKYSPDHIARNTAGEVITDASFVTKVESYGFLVTDGGVGAATYDVGTFINSPYAEADVRAAFNLGATDSTVLRVLDILMATNELTSAGGTL
jgi:hypothetical protein